VASLSSNYPIQNFDPSDSLRVINFAKEFLRRAKSRNSNYRKDFAEKRGSAYKKAIDNSCHIF
jgi:hypothetical protein